MRRLAALTQGWLLRDAGLGGATEAAALARGERGRLAVAARRGRLGEVVDAIWTELLMLKLSPAAWARCDLGGEVQRGDEAGALPSSASGKVLVRMSEVRVAVAAPSAQQQAGCAGEATGPRSTLSPSLQLD